MKEQAESRYTVSRRLIRAALFFTLFILSACQVQVFDLQPIIATQISPNPIISATPTPIAYRTTNPIAGITSTPPLHLAPTKVSEKVAAEIVDLTMLNGANGWGIAKIPKGSGKLIVKTQNGGSNWQIVTPSQVLYEQGVSAYEADAYFLDNNTAWVIYWNPEVWKVSDTITIWKTVDGGSNWTATLLPTEGYTIQRFQDATIQFLDDKIGWIFARIGSNQDREYIGLYTTHDGGETWNLMISSDSANLPSRGKKNGAAFRSAVEGWISGSDVKEEPGALLWKTNDGGNSWTKQILPSPSGESAPQEMLSNPEIRCSLAPLKFVDFQYLYAYAKLLCQGGPLENPLAFLYWTYDKGATWRIFPLPKAEGSLAFFGVYQGWYSETADPGASSPFQILTTSNGGENWNLMTQTAWDSRLQFITLAVGWGIVNYEGQYALVRTGDAGYSWEQIFPMIDPQE